MPFVPYDKHIKSSSQEKASLLAAVVSTHCQQVPEDKTMEGNKRRKARSTTPSATARILTITAASTRKQEVESEIEEQ